MYSNFINLAKNLTNEGISNLKHAVNCVKQLDGRLAKNLAKNSFLNKKIKKTSKQNRKHPFDENKTGSTWSLNQC